MDDDELIIAMASGNDTALRELFTRHALAGDRAGLNRGSPFCRPGDRRWSGVDRRAQAAGIGPRVQSSELSDDALLSPQASIEWPVT